MRLIYTDEAGTSANEPVCVVASVIVQGDEQWRILDAEMRRIIAAMVPAELLTDFVLHATEVFSGRKIERKKWSFPDRISFLKEIISLPVANNVPIAVGINFKTTDWSSKFDFSKTKKSEIGVSLDNNKFNHFLTFQSCMERADHFLRKYLDGSENGLIIAEDCPEMRRFLTVYGLSLRNIENGIALESAHLVPDEIQKLLGENPESVKLKITNIIDVPHFVEKGRASLLQLADVCAFAFRRFLSGGAHGDEFVHAMLGSAGEAFVNDPAWFSVASSGLFNTENYWNAHQRAECEQRIDNIKSAKNVNKKL